MSWQNDLKQWAKDKSRWFKDIYGVDDPDVIKLNHNVATISRKVIIFSLPFYLTLFLLPFISNNQLWLLVPVVTTIVSHLYSARKRLQPRLLQFAPYWSTVSLIFIALFYLELNDIIMIEAVVLSYLAMTLVLVIAIFYVGTK